MRRVATGFLVVFALAGCGATSSKDDELDLIDDDSGATGDGASGDGTIGDDTGDDDGGTGFDLGTMDTGSGDETAAADTGLVDSYVAPADTTCATSEVAAVKPPVDIIFAIDQSGSMTAEIVQVKANINKLSTYLQATGLDYRVVMIAGKNPSGGNAFKVCVPEPLGGPNCTSSALLRVVDQEVGSLDALKLYLSTYDQNPPSTKAWRDFLRPAALKIFVPVTDDDSRGTGNPTATQFDTQLLAKPGGHFGTAAKRNYVFYPIAGANKYPSETQCGTAVNNSAQYIALAKLTKGKWWPVCDTDYGPIFAEMGKDIAAAVACEVTIPPAPAGETFDPNKVNVIYTPSSGGSVPITKDAANPCTGANGWQVSADGTKILLCGTACSGLKADPGGKVSVQFGCAGAPPPPPPDAGTCTPFGAACGDAQACCAPLVCLPGPDGFNICRAKPPS